MERPILSVVTGTMDRRESMLRLLMSLQARTPPVPWELVVADASSIPYDIRWPLNTRLLPEHPRLGCVKGYNRAFREARGKWVAWLNDDCEVEPDWASRAVAFMEAHPDVGLGALYWRDLPDRSWHVNVAYFGVLYANFGIISKEIGDRLGWFDDDLVMYGCDVSLSYKVWLDDRGVVGIPESRILHHRVLDRNREANHRTQAPDTEVLFSKYKRCEARIKEVARRFSRRQPSPEIPVSP